MNRNPDGWGIMAVIDGIPVIQKGGIPESKSAKGKKTKEDLKAFLDTYEFFRKHEHAVHFRIQTHGNVDEENCHPYEVGEGTFLMHNGTLFDFSPTSTNKLFADKTKSDTWHFSNTIKDLAEKNWLRNESFKIILNILGRGNRLLFMDKKGFIMPNPDVWHKFEGVYYSNNSGIEQLTPSFRYKQDNWQGHKPHGQSALGPAKPSQTSGVNKTEEQVLDENRGHMFLSDGTRVVRFSNRKPESETSSGEDTLKVLPRVDSERNPQEILDSMSFLRDLPKNLKEWKGLSRLAIHDLLSAEPEMVADAVWELVHA